MKWLTGVHAKAGLHSTPPAYHLAALARFRIRQPSSPDWRSICHPKIFPNVTSSTPRRCAFSRQNGAYVNLKPRDREHPYVVILVNVAGVQLLRASHCVQGAKIRCTPRSEYWKSWCIRFKVPWLQIKQTKQSRNKCNDRQGDKD